MILHTIVVHDPGVVDEGGICPVRTCLVDIENGDINVSNNFDVIISQSCLKTHKGSVNHL